MDIFRYRWGVRTLTPNQHEFKLRYSLKGYDVDDIVKIENTIAYVNQFDNRSKVYYHFTNFNTIIIYGTVFQLDILHKVRNTIDALKKG